MFLFTEKGIFKASPTADGFGEVELAVKVDEGFPVSGDFDSEGNMYFCNIQLVSSSSPALLIWVGIICRD